MNSSKSIMSMFDRFMTVGLGCGLIALCLLACGFIYTFRNPPNARPSSTPEDGLGSPSTLTPVPAAPTFPIITSTPFPTLTATFDELIPTPVPGDSNAPLSGRIVFTCYIEQIDQICLMNADGSGRKQLTSFGATSFYSSLSPDGKTIYFVSRESGSFEVYSMNLKGKGIKRLSFVGNVYGPELSPEGDRIVFAKSGEGIWLMRSDGKNPHPITDRDDIDPTWSPDGSRIAFASSRAGQRQLFVMDKDGSDIEQLTDLNNMGGRSTWSPNGQWIAFYRGPEGDHNIFIINVNTKEVKRLTTGGDNLGPSWSPDGQWIAFTSFRDGNNEIYVIRPDGTGLTRLTNNNISDWQPRWGRD